MSVEREVERLRRLIDELEDTPCAHCAHPFTDHWYPTPGRLGGRCIYREYYTPEGWVEPKTKSWSKPHTACTCSAFVDPECVLIAQMKEEPA